jgi:energy-coupling factor transporter ATP-binding protein EcfA2
VTDSSLIIIVGQEGAGKSTTVRALVEAIPGSAQIDAEDVGEVNPWQMDDAYLRLLWKNVADLTRNFWSAGYRNVFAGSFLINVDHYWAFRDILNMPANVYVVHLCATKATRDVRRINRGKETSEEWRDMVDRVDPEDTTFASADADFRYLRIDNDGLAVAESVDVIRRWLPDVGEGSAPSQGYSAVRSFARRERASDEEPTN